MRRMRAGGVVGAIRRIRSRSAARAAARNSASSSGGRSTQRKASAPAVARVARDPLESVVEAAGCSSRRAPAERPSRAAGRRPAPARASGSCPRRSPAAPSVAAPGRRPSGRRTARRARSRRRPRRPRPRTSVRVVARSGSPAVKNGTSATRPEARSAANVAGIRLTTAAPEEVGDGVHVLVAAAREVDDQDLPTGQRGREPRRVRDRVRALERRDDALRRGQELQRLDRLGVRDGDVPCPPAVAELRVLRTDARVVESGGDRVRLANLSGLVLQQVGLVAVQHADLRRR